MTNNFSLLNYVSDDAMLLDAYSTTVSGVAHAVSESVVHIEVGKTSAKTPVAAQRGAASGSGFVISSDGFIVTNDHVVENGRDIVVSFADGRRAVAEIKGADPSTDIAVLKIDQTG